MPENNKLKLLYILEMMKKTDEFHPLNSTQIKEKLKAYMIDAERKAISRDIECLEDAGYSIIKCANHNKGWYMTDQDFEDYRAENIADAVAKAQFLTVEDTRKLIKKIKKLATAEGEKIIARTTFVDDDLKIADNKFKLKFDLLIRAITAGNRCNFSTVMKKQIDKK